MSKEGALHGLICVACAGVDMAAWRAGTISADDAAIIISLLLYNTVPIATASVDPAVGQPSKLLAAGTANSQLGVVLSSSLPLTFSQSGSSVRCRPLHAALIAPCSSLCAEATAECRCGNFMGLECLWRATPWRCTCTLVQGQRPQFSRDLMAPHGVLHPYHTPLS